MKKLILLLALIASAVTAQAQFNKGYRGFFEIGHNFGEPKEELSYGEEKYSNSISLSTTLGYQFSPWGFIGGGVGMQLWKYNNDGTKGMWSVFLEARFDFPSVSRISFYETNKIGVAGGDNDTGASVYFAPSVGARYQVNSLFGLNLSLGYQYGQKLNIGPTLSGLNIALGIDFQP